MGKMSLRGSTRRFRNRNDHIGRAPLSASMFVPARHRADPAVAARTAGDRGRHAEPMDPARREHVYARQRGGRPETPRQRRRANKKLYAALKRMPVEVTTP